MIEQLTNDIMNGKICPIHGMPLYLYRICRYKKLYTKLAPKCHTNKGRYFLLAYMSELKLPLDEVVGVAYGAVKRCNELYEPAFSERELV